MEELKPCPFCGSEAKLSPAIRGYRGFVECTNVNCQTSSPPDNGEADSNAGAIAAWNRRVPEINQEK
jgi:Lar family restriction alleviation protein